MNFYWFKHKKTKTKRNLIISKLYYFLKMNFMSINMFVFIVCVLSFKTFYVNSFIPYAEIKSLVDELGSELISTLEKASDTVTHDDIIQYGLTQSVADYFRDKPNGTNLILTSKYDNSYKDIKEVYYDYYLIIYLTIFDFND